MKIPTLPHSNLVDKDGILTLPWRKFFSQLTFSLQNDLSNEGYLIPVIEDITHSKRNTIANSGLVIYDKTTHHLYINENGTFKQLTTTT